MVPTKVCMVTVAAGLLAGAACDFVDFEDGQRYSEDFQRSYDLRSGGRIELESFNGTVELMGWDRDKVEVSGTKYASRKEALNEIKVEISNSPDAVSIRTQRPPREGWLKRVNMGVSYRIHVPRKVIADRIVTSNGAVRIESIEGRVRVKTSNGTVRLHDLAGDTSAESSNGRIEVERARGALELHTSNGTVSAKGVEGSLAVVTSNGAIDVEAEKLDPGKPLKLDTSNGAVKIRLVGSGATPEVRAHSSNGRISLSLPESASARLRAATSNAPINCELKLNNVTKTGKHRLEGEIGQGGPLIDLSSSNGTIEVKRN